jgi:hypothetical protein
MATYFNIPNHITREIDRTFGDPLEAAAVALKNSTSHTDKAQRRAWLADPKTQTAIISLFEGLNPSLRVSVKEGNPVVLIHGIIADYDSTAPGNFQDQIKHVQDFYANTSPSLTPQWIQRTFSGHFRLVWEFAEPCSLRGCHDQFLVAFVAEFKKLCRMSAVLAALDEAALVKASTYYDAMGDWERINPNPFPVVDVDGVFFGAVRKAAKEKDHGGLTEIPMEAIKQKIDDLYPGRWPVDVPFVEGCRGPAVWDPIGLNPTTTIYTTTGAFRFSTAKGFHSYEELLGKDFVRGWQDNKMGQVAKHFYFQPRARCYFTKINGTWEVQGLTDIQRRLINDWSLSRKPPSHNRGSETEQAVQYIQDYRKIDATLPFIFNKKEVVEMNNNLFLNTSRVRVMEPAPDAVNIPNSPITRNKVRPNANSPYAWSDGFPWIASWLGSWFDDPRRQLVYLLCWLKQGYESARSGDPAKGQALFLVGGTDRGKTLFNGPDFCGAIFGSSVDASNFLVGGTQFNKELIEAGYWRVDDAQAATNKEQHTKFTERVKAHVANPTIQYQPKYVDSQSVVYNGRLCITLNEDDDSMRMIPDLDRNIVDKLIILKLASRTAFSFPQTRGDISKLLKSQIPYFLRWLLHWTPPKQLTMGQTRFGMRSYIHKAVRTASLMSGLESDLLDITGVLWANDDEFCNLLKTGGAWEGSAAEFFGVLMGNPMTSQLTRGMTPRVLGRKLAALAEIKGSGVERTITRTKVSRYKLYAPEILLPHEDSPKFLKPSTVK